MQKRGIFVLCICLLNLLMINSIPKVQSAPFWYPDLIINFENGNGTVYTTNTLVVEWDYILMGGIYGEGVIINDTTYYEQVDWIVNFTILTPKGNIIYQSLVLSSLSDLIHGFEYIPEAEGFTTENGQTFTFHFIYYTNIGSDEFGSFGDKRNDVYIMYIWDYTPSNTTLYIILGIVGIAGVIIIYLLVSRNRMKDYCNPNMNPNNFYYDPQCSKERIKRGYPY